MNNSQLLSSIPDGLRLPLLKEYEEIKKNYIEKRWTPSELSGGKFCEIVFCILDGYAKGTYLSSPKKPRDFATACRGLENCTNVPRSFQILIPRILPSLYEIRNNRGVGHIGGDVDSNHMDSTAVLSMANWVMAELVRVFHKLTTVEAQRAVDAIVERKTPLIWETEGAKRILKPEMKFKDQILLLLTQSHMKVKVEQLLSWINNKNLTYLVKILRELDKKSFVFLSQDEIYVEILPPGTNFIEKAIAKTI